MRRRQTGIRYNGPWQHGMAARGLILRAVVLRTYLPGDPAHPGRVPVLARVGPVVGGQIGGQQIVRYADKHLHDVLCDVLPYGGKIRSSVMQMVPVAQRWGRSDVWESWVPRPCRYGTAGIAAVPTGIDMADPRDLDGDHVLVAFLEGDLLQPVIIGGLKHPASESAQPAWRDPASGTASRYLVRHRGAQFSIDSDGNLTLDASVPSSGVYDTTGAETVGTGGTVLIKGAAGKFATLSGGKARVTGSTDARVQAPAVELAASGAPATRRVARSNDPTRANVNVVSNVAWHTFFSTVAAFVGGAAVGQLATAEAAGIVGTITDGHPNIKTD